MPTLPEGDTTKTAKKKKSLIRKIDHKQGKLGTRPPALSEEEQEQLRLVRKFRQACDLRDVQHVMDCYPTLLAAGLFTAYDTRRITQVLHVRLRNENTPAKRDEIFPFVQQVVSDLRRGKLEPHPYAYVHLFGIYKDCKRFGEGYALWQWLVEQDEQHVSQAAYGAAIELMAYGRLMSLPDMENLYSEGLKRFPGTFAEYHLSPDAIVPDRTRLTTISGIPTILLQGILTARMLARDWKNAYLALDTALRIYPTQTPPRYFELFMTERPISEGYTAFMIACRAGIAMRPTHVTALITKLRAAMKASQSMADRLMLLRVIANAIYGHLEAGGNIESIHVGSLFRAFEQILPEPIPGEDYTGEAAKMRDTLVATAHQMLSELIQAGMPPSLQPFEALISISGKLRVPSLLETTLQDMAAAGLRFGLIGKRTALTTAGLLKDKNMVKEYWSNIVLTAEADSTQISFEDWITFTKACRRAGLGDFFRSQILKLPYAISDSTERYLIQQIEMPETPSALHEVYQYTSMEDLTAELDALKAQMKNIEAVVMSGQPLDLRNSPLYMHLDPEHPSLSNTGDLRAVYDEFTLDPHQPPLPPPAPDSPEQLPMSTTGIPLDELRFQNWVSIHEMMDSASEYESDLKYAVDSAIKAGTPLQGTPELLRLRKDPGPKRTQAGLSLKIKELRASRPEDVSIFRRVGSETPEGVTISKHFAKNEEPIVVGEKGAPRIRKYAGLQSNHDAPSNFLRRAKRKDDNSIEAVEDALTAEMAQASPRDN
ncbi:hypothetical protein J4E86_000272 [Alternaria arbusti]|uniref:uncharacterized protein n=1 Tax=Alternaria arbusti TaxID=232088 RepID=UPI00221FA586|nr:uncharacterized protein J4E86_000272 [Alternaria arbusti]KAI4961245.1 hypothetical protein J4E86_000272 [Alternaria arbusti]